MEAVDANLVGGRWLLITMLDGVLQFDVDLIGRSTPNDRTKSDIREEIAETLTPDWRVDSLQQTSQKLVGAV